MNEKEKKAIKRIYDVTHNSDGSHVNYIDIDDVVNTKEDLDSCEGFCEAIEILLNLIEKQQKEIEELKENSIKVIDYEQGLKKIIDAEDDPDTWAYHAVQKLLKEVGGGNYERR